MWIRTRCSTPGATIQSTASARSKSIARQRGTAADLDANPQTWKEVYAYDAASRPTMISTTTYDSTYGRVDTQTYPALPTGGTALTVQHTYTAYGQLDALRV